MKKISAARKPLTVFALCNLMCLTLIPAAHAQDSSWTDTVKIKNQATFQYISEDDRDLDISGDDSNDSFSQQLQTSLEAKPTDHTTFFIHGRALNIDGDAGFDDDTGQTESLEQSFLELRELWVRWEELGGIVPLSLQVGRQRIKEPRALWWNSDFDMARINYNSTLLNGFIGVGEDLASYRTGPNNDFQEDEEDRLRTLGELSWQYQMNHYLEGRFLYEHDHSDTDAAGTVIGSNDRDDSDLDAAWAGLRTTGAFMEPSTAIREIKYRADIVGLFGDEDQTASVAGPGAGQRTIGATTNNDVRAWAFDSGATLAPKIMGNPVFTVGYSFGSGDDDATDNTDHAFRQTDLQGSSSRIGLERQAQKNYGEVLRPELSNLHILTAGAGLPLTDATDIGLTYFNYRLAEDATSLRSSGISAPMTGTDKDVGQAADFIVNVDVDDQFGVKSAYVDDIGFRFVLGGFFPGDAYEPNDDENAYRVFTELKLRF